MSDVMVHPVLAELEQRAGASDKDRAVWLAERMGGVTATQIKELYFGGPTVRRELIEEKLGTRQNTFNGNQYTAWGNKREPIIAAWVQSLFAITPESRVFRAKGNARHLASPDGVAVSFDGSVTLAEIKTSKHDISKDTPIFEKYYVQMIWQMYVMGADRCVYAFERHDDQWRDVGGQYLEPTPLGEPGTEWVYFDEKLAAELVELADGFLTELDAARAALDAGEGPVVDEDLDTLAVNYARFRDMESEGKRAKEAAGAQIKELLKDKASFSQESALARISWTRGGEVVTVQKIEREHVDVDAAKVAHAKEWEALEKADAAADRAVARREKAGAAWLSMLKLHTTVEVVEEPTTKTVRENLTVTVPKIKEMGK